MNISLSPFAPENLYDDTILMRGYDGTVYNNAYFCKVGSDSDFRPTLQPCDLRLLSVALVGVNLLIYT